MRILLIFALLSAAAGLGWSQAISVSPANGSTLAYDSNGCVDITMTSNVGTVSGIFWFGAYSGNPMYTPNAGINFTITAGYPYPITTCNVPSSDTVTRSQFTAVVLSPSAYYNQWTIFVYNNPPNPTQSSLTVTDITSDTTLPDDYNPNESLSMVRRVRLNNGGAVDVPRGDLLSIGTLSYTFTSDGRFSYTFDNTEAAFVRVGTSPLFGWRVLSHGEPSGWHLHGATWGGGKDPGRNSAAVYSVATDYLPGLMPLFVQSDAFGFVAARNGGKLRLVPMTGITDDNERIARAAVIENNSLRRFVIGPAFAPGSSQKDVMAEVKTWVSDYGFTFLQPLLDASDPKAALDTLSPSNQLETDIVTCLRAVL